MNPRSFNVKIGDEALSRASIYLAASNGNSDYDIKVGTIHTEDNRVLFTKTVPVCFITQIAAAIVNYTNYKEVADETREE